MMQSIRLIARLLLSLVSLLFVTAALSSCRQQQNYPDHPIVLLCPWAVGGGTDRVSRQVAAFLEQELGVPVNVVNATGGAGVTGHSRGSRSRPDGYTMMMMTVELNMLHWRELTKISPQDFEPVLLLNQDPAALFVRADETRWQTVNDLLTHAQKNPGALTGSGTAMGGIWHLALGGLLNSAGISPANIKWIPTSGAGPALQELASGGIDVVVCALPEARTLMLSNKVRALGVMADERLPGWSDVPTLKEQNVAWSMGGWRGIGVPKGTPPEITAKLERALTRIVKGEVAVAGRKFPEYMATEGFNMSWQPASEFQNTLATFDRKLGALLTRPEFSSVNTDRFPPMHFPKLIAAAAALILLALFVLSRRKTGAVVSEPRGTFGIVSRPAMFLFAEFVLAVVAFALLAETVGFILIASLLLFYLLWRLGSQPLQSALIAVLVVSVAYTFFATLMRVPLPRGWLGW